MEPALCSLDASFGQGDPQLLPHPWRWVADESTNHYKDFNNYYP